MSAYKQFIFIGSIFIQIMNLALLVLGKTTPTSFGLLSVSMGVVIGLFYYDKNRLKTK